MTIEMELVEFGLVGCHLAFILILLSKEQNNLLTSGLMTHKIMGIILSVHMFLFCSIIFFILL